MPSYDPKHDLAGPLLNDALNPDAYAAWTLVADTFAQLVDAQLAHNKALAAAAQALDIDIDEALAAIDHYGDIARRVADVLAVDALGGGA